MLDLILSCDSGCVQYVNKMMFVYRILHCDGVNIGCDGVTG